MKTLTKKQLEYALKQGAYEKWENCTIEYMDEQGEPSGVKSWADIYLVLDKPVLAEPYRLNEDGTKHYYNRAWNTLEDDGFIINDWGNYSKVNPAINVWGTIEHPYSGRLGFNVTQTIDLMQFNEKKLIDLIEDQLGFCFAEPGMKGVRYEIMKVFKTIKIEGQQDGESILEALNRQLFAPQLQA